MLSRHHKHSNVSELPQKRIIVSMAKRSIKRHKQAKSILKNSNRIEVPAKNLKKALRIRKRS